MKDILISDKADVVVVDDQPENLKLLLGLLAPHFTVHPFTRGGDLYRYLAAGHPADLILLDVVMPAPDGLEICRTLRRNLELIDVPIVFLTSLDSSTDEEIGLATGAVDYITKPFSPPIVLARVNHHVRLGRALRTIQNLNDFLDQRVEERTAELVRKNSELMRTQEATIHALSVLVETRDSDTGHHIHRTQHYLRELALAARRHDDFVAQLDDAMIAELFRSAPLHDIGKVAIPDRVLLKPGRLDSDEFDLMKTHTTHGRDAIARAEKVIGSSDSFLNHAREIAFSHHERWDGNGYPQGLGGEDIPLSARLMAIADVYDALISSRSYKTGMSHEKAIGIIREGRGTQFDPRVVDIFLDIHHRFDEIARQFVDSETVV